MDLERAEDLLRRGRYDDAVDSFRELLSMEPERPDLRGRVAEAYRLAGNPERAFHHFHKAATIYCRTQDLLGAARMLEAANHVSPNEPDVLFRLAEVLKKLGKQRPLNVVLHNLIKAAAAPGDRRRLWALEELCQQSPQDVDLQARRAQALVEAGRIREAVTIWQHVSDHLAARGVDLSPVLVKAAEAAPEAPLVGVPLAQLLLRHGRPREALALIVPFYEKFPDDVHVLEALLAALETLGATDKILPARLELLKARTRAGQRAETLDEVKRLLAHHAADPRVLEVCAHACAAFGLSGEACRIWFDLAGVYDRHGMPKERDRVVVRILEAKPNHEGALELGARVLRASGRPREAAQLEQRLEDLRGRSEDDLPALPAAHADADADADAEVTARQRPSDSASDRAYAMAGTVVLQDDDVLEASDVELEEDDFEDVFDTDTPAQATHAGDAPTGPPGDVSVLDADTATSVMPLEGRREVGHSLFEDTREEAPAAILEEPTFRMDAKMTSELSALREELDAEEATATELDAIIEPMPTPRVRTASRAHGRLVSDLLDEMSKKALE